MSVETIAPAPVADATAEVVEATTVETPKVETVTVPDSDANVKVNETIDRAVLLLTAANTLPADKREDLDTRAFTQLARHLANKWDGDDATVTVFDQDMPQYGESGKGSLRYTRQRSELFAALAQSNAMQGEAVSLGRYHYPNPKTSRKTWVGRVWGAKADLARVQAIFPVLQDRVIKDAYKIEFAANTLPAEQAKIRREFWDNEIHNLTERMDSVMDPQIVKSRAENRIAERQARATARRDADMNVTDDE